MAQVVAAKVEQLEVFGQQELFGPEMFDIVAGQIHLHYVRRQVGWDTVQICGGRNTDKHIVFNSECWEEGKVWERKHAVLKRHKGLLNFQKDWISYRHNELTPGI